MIDSMYMVSVPLTNNMQREKELIVWLRALPKNSHTWSNCTQHVYFYNENDAAAFSLKFGNYTK